MNSKRHALKLLSPLLLACLPWAAPSPAQAGAPFVTDDPEVLEQDVLDITLASTALGTRSRFEGSNSLEVNYGLNGKVHLHVLIPQSFLKENQESLIRGAGDVEVGLKIKLVDLPDSGLKVSTYPALEIPVDRTADGDGDKKLQLYLPVWIQKTEGPWTTYGGAGYLINRNDGKKDSVFTGIEIQRQMSERFTVGGEVYHSTASEPGGQSSTRANVGLILNLDEVNHIMIGAGRNIDGHERDYRVYIAYNVSIGPKGEGTNPFSLVRNLFRQGN